MDEATLHLFGRLGIALAIGALVGLQRETSDARLAGVRTFALFGLAGTLTALTDRHWESSGWIIVAGLAALGAVIVVSKHQIDEDDIGDVGMTTAIALIVVFLTGVYVLEGSLIVAGAVSVAVATLLQFKPELHSIAGRLTDKDVRAILQFAVFSCVVLPVLPNRQMGPLNMFNPFNTWLMVVLIVGISLAGYIAYKFFGRSAGAIVGGLLGGTISSTATSLSYARKAHQSPQTLKLATTVIVIASSVVFVRVLIEIAVVAPSHFLELAPPIAIMLGACCISSMIAWGMFRGQNEPRKEPSNPTELKSALMFGGLYALVLWGLAATREYLNQDAMYVVAALSGLTDMDAITLSTANLVENDPFADNVPDAGNLQGLDYRVAVRLLLTAAIANLVFKGGIVAFIGGWKLLARVGLLFLIPVVCGLLLIWLW